MNLVKRNGHVVYEDLLRELELVEQQLMTENSAMAMNVMVLEAKLRDRFHQMEQQAQGNAATYMPHELLIRDDMSASELEALIPRDLPDFPMAPFSKHTSQAKTWETVGVAALLAVATACSVFGLATALQVLLGWLA